MISTTSHENKRKSICFTDRDIADLHRLHDYVPAKNTSERIRMIYRKGVEAYEEERIIATYNSIAEDEEVLTEYVKSRRGRHQDW